MRKLECRIMKGIYSLAILSRERYVERCRDTKRKENICVERRTGTESRQNMHKKGKEESVSERRKVMQGRNYK